MKASDGAWTELDVENISDVVVPLGNETASLEIEVLEEGSSIPVAYSVPISSQGGLDIWPTQVLVFLSGMATLWFFIFAVKRRRNSQIA